MSALPVTSSPDEPLLGAVREPANRRFIEAWLAWRSPGHLLPNRGVMEIADIRDLLGSVALFEVLGPDELRIKVAGTRLRDHANFEATGKNLAEITPPGLWPIRRHRMMSVASWPCASVSLKLDRRTLGYGTTFEMVTLPIDADEPGGARLLISCVTPMGGVYEPPAPDRAPFLLLADAFTFVDVGAGTPERTEP